MMKPVRRHQRNKGASGALPGSTGIRMLLSALLVPFACASDFPALADSFGDAADALGFSHYVISRISRTRSGTSMEIIRAYYPDHWVRHYEQCGYATVDPVHRAAFDHALPFRWHDIPNLNRTEQRVLDEAREAGLHNGICVPIHDATGSVLLVNLSGSPSTVNAKVNHRLAYMICTQFYFEFQRLMQYQPPATPAHLSPRQRECLTWVARGKSSWAIARILGISHHTVDYHIAEAMKNLNVTSRTAAAVNATVQGLIQR